MIFILLTFDIDSMWCNKQIRLALKYINISTYEHNEQDMYTHLHMVQYYSIFFLDEIFKITEVKPT